MNSALQKLLVLGVFAEIAILLTSYLLYPSMEEVFRHAARFSGRLSAVVFLAAFYLFATSFPKPISDNRSLRNSIVVFAVLHVIHLGLLATNVYLNNVPLEAVKLAGGALAYLMIVVAPFQLHKMKFGFQVVYFYYVSLVMMLTYVARIKGDFEGAEPFWLHYIALSVFFLCSVIFALILVRKARAQRK